MVLKRREWNHEWRKAQAPAFTFYSLHRSTQSVNILITQSIERRSQNHSPAANRAMGLGFLPQRDAGAAGGGAGGMEAQMQHDHRLRFAPPPDRWADPASAARVESRPRDPPLIIRQKKGFEGYFRFEV
jgi:hypothetical protein